MCPSEDRKTGRTCACMTRSHHIVTFIMLNTMLFHLAGQALHSVLGSWVSRRFFGGCAVLFPMVVTVYITWWFLTFFDNFFSVRRLCCYVCSRSCWVCACQNAHSPCVNRVLCAHAAGV